MCDTISFWTCSLLVSGQSRQFCLDWFGESIMSVEPTHNIWSFETAEKRREGGNREDGLLCLICFYFIILLSSALSHSLSVQPLNLTFTIKTHAWLISRRQSVNTSPSVSGVSLPDEHWQHIPWGYGLQTADDIQFKQLHKHCCLALGAPNLK